MSDSNIVKTTQQIAVPTESWDKALRIASILSARGKRSSIGTVVAEAVEVYYNQLPADIREFMENQEPEAAPLPQGQG